MAFLRGKPEGAKETRQEYRRKKELPLGMPEIYLFDYVIDWLDELGWYKAGESVITPNEWTDLAAWIQATKTEPTPFETRLLMKLSRQYCYQSYVSDKEDCEEPNPTEVKQDDMIVVREEADKKLRSLF